MEPTPARFEVRSFETDPDGQLTLSALGAFLQEAARRNAAAIGAGVDLLAEHNLAWVLHRLRLEIAALPRVAHTVDVTTWASHWDNVVARREFEVHAPDGRRLVAGTSRWVVVDLGSRRVVRLPEFVRALTLPGRAPALAFGGEGLPAAEPADTRRRIDVRRSDLDAARHANNTRYVDWALEALPDEFVERHRPARFEIVFRRESVAGDTLVSQARRHAAGNGDARFAHALVRVGDGALLAQAVSDWRPVVDDDGCTGPQARLTAAD